MSKLENRLSRRKKGKEPPPQADKPQVPEQEIVPQSKSDIIEQLKKRMKKIESQPARAFGRKRSSQIVTPLPVATFNPILKSQGADVSEASDHEPSDNEPSDDEPKVVRESLLPGYVMDTSMGEIWVNRQEYPGYFHGNEPVERYLDTGNALATFAKDKRLTDVSPKDALFIDTETTGLSGGAGTLPFLIGVGFFEGDSFVVEQYFSREPAEEPAQLEALSRRLEQAAYLVSFNGKSFDMPLINTRYIINKQVNPGYNLPHLDLLHVSRRIFKRRLNDRSLQNIERVILKFERHGDIPGAQIPEAYRDYLFGHGEDRIAAILEHNLLDIVALAALGGVLDKIYADPDAVAHAADHLGLAGEAFGAGEFSIGDRHLDVAGQVATGDDKRFALHMKANTELKRKNYSSARDVYMQVVELYPDDSDAHFRLAKLFEHREKNYDKALFHAEKMGELEGEDGMKRRIERLQKKKEKYEKRNKW